MILSDIEYFCTLVPWEWEWHWLSLAMETGDLSRTNSTAGSPPANQNKQTPAGTPIPSTSTLELSSQPVGGPSNKTLLLKEKASNSSIKKFCISPSIKRVAAENDNLENLCSRQAKKSSGVLFELSPISPKIVQTPSPDSSPNKSSSDMEVLDTTMTPESPSPLFEVAPPLDAEEINPQLRNFLQFMLQENRASTEKILAAQTATVKRLDTLEQTVQSNRTDQIKEMNTIRSRISAVEKLVTPRIGKKNGVSGQGCQTKQHNHERVIFSR